MWLEFTSVIAISLFFSPYLSLDTVQFGYQYLLPVTLETGQGLLSSQLIILHLSQRFCP